MCWQMQLGPFSYSRLAYKAFELVDGKDALSLSQRLVQYPYASSLEKMKESQKLGNGRSAYGA